MRKIPLTYSLLTYLDDLEFTEAALSADPDTQSLVAPFQEAIAEWDSLFKKERLARRDVTRADAVVSVRNERLDVLTVRFAAAARAFAAELLGKLFGSTAPGQFVRRGLRVQCEKTRDVILPELGKLDPAHPLKPFAPQLDAGVGGALHALDARAKAKGARQVISNETDEWKEGVNALRTTTYAELLKLGTAKKYPKSWVESFFRQPEQKTPEEEDGDAPAVEPAPDPT